MKKVLLKPQPLICAPPTVLVGTMVEGKPNFHGGGLVRRGEQRTSDGLSRHPAGALLTERNPDREFSVNVPSVDIVKEVDYCG